MPYAIGIGLIGLIVIAAYLLAEGITPPEALRRILRLRSRGR
jgi:hypothetical protein